MRFQLITTNYFLLNIDMLSVKAICYNNDFFIKKILISFSLSLCFFVGVFFVGVFFVGHLGGFEFAIDGACCDAQKLCGEFFVAGPTQGFVCRWSGWHICRVGPALSNNELWNNISLSRKLKVQLQPLNKERVINRKQS